MLFNTKIEKVLELFLKSPTQEFKYRELIKLTKLGSSTIKRALEILTQNKLILKTENKYEANRENKTFKTLKFFHTLYNLNPLLDLISKKIRPNCLVLFGSASKGEDTEKSDVDLFIQSNKKEVNLTKTEKALNRKINLLFESDIKKINQELLNNLANGITLYGFLEVKT